MKHRSRWLAALAAITLSTVGATAALGYAGEVAGSVQVGVSGTVTCESPITVTATVQDADGKLISEQPVAWEFVSSPSDEDVINTTPTATNAEGVASTTVELACVAGERRIRATADDVSAEAVLSLGGAGLPNTSTTSTPQLVPLLLVAILSTFVGGGIMLRRLAFIRR